MSTASADDQRAAFEWVKHMSSGDYVDTRIGEDFVNAAGQPARTSLLNKYADKQPYFDALAKSIPICTPGFVWVPPTFTLADTLGNDVAAVIAGEKGMGRGARGHRRGTAPDHGG